MNCPSCQIPLAMSDRQGVEVDYCPQCRGVWLDRGELDKIIERSSREWSEPSHQPGHSAPPAQPRYQQQDSHRYRSHDDGNDHRRHGSHKNNRGKSFLGELFDF